MLRRGRRTALGALLLAGAVSGVDDAAAQSGRHAVTGMVMHVDQVHRRIVVSHDSIPGVMPAMTMPFAVAEPKQLAAVVPGSQVRFIMVAGPEALRAERIEVVPYASAEPDPSTASRLRLLRHLTGARPTPIAVGRVVPDFTLTNQVRDVISLSQLRGQVVAVNFIYTSCAYPQFCLRIANQFGVVQKRFRNRLGRDLALLTVTFDPGRDTPERLAAYAQQWDADPRTWRFLTGSAADVQRVAGMFGVDFFPDEGLMNHSVHTAVLDRQGRLVANIEGNSYTAVQLGDLVEATLNR